MTDSIINKLHAHFAGAIIQEFHITKTGQLKALEMAVSSPDTWLTHCTALEYATGIWRLIDPSEADHAFLLTDQDLVYEDRAKVIAQLEALFISFFADHCDAKLYHKSDIQNLNSINKICFNFWDVIPLHPTSTVKEPELREHCIAILNTILQSPNIAVQEAALNGLGNWQEGCPIQIYECIKGYLENNKNKDLTKFALSCLP